MTTHDPARRHRARCHEATGKEFDRFSRRSSGRQLLPGGASTAAGGVSAPPSFS
jgi:hypothetical protein